jgi:hypothetical protein
MIPISTALGVMGWGLDLIYWGGTAGNETRVDVAAVEAGSDLESRLVVVRGKLLAEEAISLSRRRRQLIEVFVPLVSPNWTPGRPIALALKTRVSDRELVESGDRFRGPAFEGVISPSGLPGPIRVRFERKGLTRGDRCLVLDFRGRPEEVMREGIFGLVTGLLFASFFFAAWLPLLRRNRPKSTSAVQETSRRNRPKSASAVQATMTFGDKALPPVVGWSIFGGFMVLMLICLIYAMRSGR